MSKLFVPTILFYCASLPSMFGLALVRCLHAGQSLFVFIESFLSLQFFCLTRFDWSGMFDSLSEFEQQLNEKEATRAPNRWADRQKGSKTKPQEPVVVPTRALRKLAEPMAPAASLSTTVRISTRRVGGSGSTSSGGSGVKGVSSSSGGGGADATSDVIRRPNVGVLAQYTSSGANALNRPDRPPPKVIHDILESQASIVL